MRILSIEYLLFIQGLIIPFENNKRNALMQKCNIFIV